MKGRHLPSSFPENARLAVDGLRYGTNGPYRFSCAPAECIGISGPSGVGKTLLLRSLADLDEHRGDIRLDGRDHRDYPAPLWRRLVTMVPAESRWWHEEVGGHLPPGYDRREALAIAAACGFSPDVFGWHVSRLSTGEKQRLAVVRALIRKPAVLLLDEVGAHLDYHNTALLEDLIMAYRDRQQAAIIWVSHDHAQLERLADRRFNLHRTSLEERPQEAGRGES